MSDNEPTSIPAPTSATDATPSRGEKTAREETGRTGVSPPEKATKTGADDDAGETAAPAAAAPPRVAGASAAGAARLKEKKKRGDCHTRAKYHPGDDDVSTYGGLWTLFVEHGWSSFCLVKDCYRAVLVDYPRLTKGKIGRIWPRCQGCHEKMLDLPDDLKVKMLDLPDDLKVKFLDPRSSQGTVTRDWPVDKDAVISWDLKNNNNTPPIKTITAPADEREPLVNM